MNWKGKHVLVTGGTSFIGSSLADSLVSGGVIVRVVDDLSIGRYEYISRSWEPRFPFREGIIKTSDWYVKNRNPDEVHSQLQPMLTER